MKKTLLFGNRSRRELLKGIRKVSKAVGATIGPDGRNAVFNKAYGTVVTNDGVSIAKEFELKGIEGIGANMLIEAAQKTNDVAGDGTTTSVVLAHSLIELSKNVRNPIRVRKEIDKASEVIIEELKRVSRMDFTVEEVATVSSGSQEIGSLLQEIFSKVGKDGAISVEDGPIGTSVEYMEGLQIPYGFMSPYFTSDGISVSYDSVPTLISKRKIEIKELLPLMENLRNKGETRLVVLTQAIDPDSLQKLIVTKLTGKFTTLFVQVRDNDLLDDIGGLLGIDVADAKELDESNLGEASIRCTKDKTTIIGGDPRSRIEYLRMLKPKNEWEEEQIRNRIAKLNGGACVIRIGATTDIELKEKKDRLEDAINASRAALEEGVVDGGGLALWTTSVIFDSFFEPNEGEIILREAIRSPIKKIAKNSYKSVPDIIDDVVIKNIKDPVKVTITALRNAVSVAGSFLTTESAIHTEVNDETT